MNSYETILGSAQTKFTKIVKKPEKFLKQEDEVFEDIKLLSKVRKLATNVQYFGIFYERISLFFKVIQGKTKSINCHQYY